MVIFNSDSPTSIENFDIDVKNTFTEMSILKKFFRAMARDIGYELQGSDAQSQSHY